MNGPQILLTQQDAGASFSFDGAWTQVPASWAAASAETFPSTATFAQAAATWAAVVSEAFAATGSFTQAAAAWSAAVAETFAATATWTQAAASWSSTAGETFTSTATWSQAAATWAAEANQTSDRTSTASWEQAAASWDGSVSVPLPVGGTSGKFGIVRQRRVQPVIQKPIPQPVYDSDAAFIQPAASWAAIARYDDDDLAILLAA